MPAPARSPSKQTASGDRNPSTRARHRIGWTASGRRLQFPTCRPRRVPMGAKSEALAKEFEAKAREATAVLEKLTDADWKKVTEAEKWTVGVTAHHVAGSHEPIANIIKTVAA